MIVYYSRTNNTKKMLAKLNMEIDCVSIDKYSGIGKYVLVTPSYGLGEVPKEVDEFLAKHSKNMIAVIGGGNRNWGLRFCNGAKIISRDYNVPLLYKFELTGLKNEIKDIRKVIGEIKWNTLG